MIKTPYGPMMTCSLLINNTDQQRAEKKYNPGISRNQRIYLFLQSSIIPMKTTSAGPVIVTVSLKRILSGPPFVSTMQSLLT
ncbi:hypothetical protein KTGMC3_P2149 [Methanocalculus sp. MC3]